MPRTKFNSNKFNKGDIVRLKNGKLPLIVDHVFGYLHGPRYNLIYLHSQAHRDNEMESNIIKYYEENPQTEAKENNMTQLYEYTNNGTTVFGTRLAVNSEGKWVMESKGSGDVFVAAAKDLKKIMPYTIGVKFGQNEQTYSCLAEKGKYEKGQVFLVTSPQGNYQFAVIADVDTESDKATKEFAPIARIVTEGI